MLSVALDAVTEPTINGDTHILIPNANTGDVARNGHSVSSALGGEGVWH